MEFPIVHILCSSRSRFPMRDVRPSSLPNILTASMGSLCFLASHRLDSFPKSLDLKHGCHFLQFRGLELLQVRIVLTSLDFCVDFGFEEYLESLGLQSTRPLFPEVARRRFAALQQNWAKCLARSRSRFRTVAAAGVSGKLSDGFISWPSVSFVWSGIRTRHEGFSTCYTSLTWVRGLTVGHRSDRCTTAYPTFPEKNYRTRRCWPTGDADNLFAESVRFAI